MAGKNVTAVLVLMDGTRLNVTELSVEQVAGALMIDPHKGVSFSIAPRGGGTPVTAYVRAAAIAVVLPPDTL